MKLIATYQDEKIPVVVERYGAGYRVTLRDATFVVDMIAAEFMRSLRFEDGRQFLFLHHNDGNAHEVSFGNDTVRLEMHDPLAMRRAASGDAAAASGNVRALMPGRVVRVMVKPGDAVSPGQGLLILEAMKMENEITASREGVVSAVLVEPGQTVEGGADLMVIE
jgi:biotin carboxyl carrier protein